jgi:tetrapyrrole methylase family protein / MazG family protein
MTQSSGTVFEQLLTIMARLRGSDGCPWDREQTRASLKPFLIEEAYEVLEAIDANDDQALVEELGDLLLQVVFHAQIGAETDAFEMRDILQRLCDKMIRRHPHVFGNTRLDTAQAVLAQWETIKQREATRAGGSRSVIDGVPRALPALIRAQRMQSKAARVKFDWPDAGSAWTKVKEEVEEAGEALASGDLGHFREELGDLLFSVVNVARLSSLDAEAALQGAIEKFRRRFTDMEAALVAEGKSVTAVGQDELERSWEAMKARERQG